VVGTHLYLVFSWSGAAYLAYANTYTSLCKSDLYCGTSRDMSLLRKGCGITMGFLVVRKAVSVLNLQADY